LGPSDRPGPSQATDHIGRRAEVAGRRRTTEPGQARRPVPPAPVASPGMSQSSDEFAARLRRRISDGVLAFPLTPFRDDLEVDLAAFRSHLRGQLDARPAAVFPCCGTGEFFSLAEPEYERLVAVAVEESAGRVPVVAGIGYGFAQAARFAAAAERAGADAVLLLPHYLVGAPQDGLVAQVREVAGRTRLPLIVYQRDHVTYSAGALAELAAIPNVVGLKDGHGDLDQMQRLRLAAPEGFL